MYKSYSQGLSNKWWTVLIQIYAAIFLLICAACETNVALSANTDSINDVEHSTKVVNDSITPSNNSSYVTKNTDDNHYKYLLPEREKYTPNGNYHYVEKKDAPLRDNKIIASAQNESSTIKISSNITIKDGNESDISKSDIIAIIGLVIAIFGSIFNFIYTIIKDKSNKRETYIYDFWLREVLYPSIISEVKVLATSSRAALMSSKFELGKFYTEFFLEKINNIKDSSVLMSSFDSEFPAFINDRMDELEDLIASHQTDRETIDAQALQKSIEVVVKKIIEKLHEIHTSKINIHTKP